MQKKKKIAKKKTKLGDRKNVKKKERQKKKTE